MTDHALNTDELAVLAHIHDAEDAQLSGEQSREFLRDLWGRADDARASAMLDDLCERGYLFKTWIGTEVDSRVDGYRFTLWGTFQIRVDWVTSPG